MNSATDQPRTGRGGKRAGSGRKPKPPADMPTVIIAAGAVSIGRITAAGVVVTAQDATAVAPITAAVEQDTAEQLREPSAARAALHRPELVGV